MTNKPKSIFEAWEERELENSKDFKYLSNFFNYLDNQSLPEDFDLKETIDNLDNPASLSFIYSLMLENPNKMGSWNIGSIKNINEDFYRKLLAIYKIVDTNTYYTYKKINKASKEKFNPFQTETEDSINAINSRLDAQNTSIKSIEEKNEHTDEKIENKIKSKVYSEFIAILGIFTAITFAIFGGMNLLSNLFQNIGSTPASLGQTLILAAVFGLIMWGIIELLFYWISKIKGITDSTKDKNKTYFNLLAIGVLAGVLILGIWLFTKATK